MAKDLWELESDIFTNYEGTITEATFRFSEYGGQMSFTLDEIDGRDGPTFENYNLPPGWESVDGGETIIRVDGSEKGIVKSSQWGKFLGAAGGLSGVKEAVGAEAPITAAPWIGCRFRMEVTDLGRGKPYKFEKDGEKVEGVSKDKNYPTAFLGKDQSMTSTTSTNGQAGDSLSVLTDLHNPVLESQITDLAKELEYKEWFSRSYALLTTHGIGASDVPDLLTAMGTPALYEKLRG